jgi:acetyltransferase-like isoleucine patch superfamily enzyme
MLPLPNTFKQWLKLQRSLWRASGRIAQARRRWPTLRLTEPLSWIDADFDAVEFGKWVQIGPFTEIVAQTVRKESGVRGGLTIGDNTCIGASGNIRAVGGKIVIGRDCLIAQHVSLIASNHGIRRGEIYWQLPWDERRAGITIGDNVWIGCGVTVLPGCEIGSNAVVGAGSIVTKNVPAGTIWAGNPARQMRVIA